MLHRNVDVTDTSVYVIGENRACRQLITLFRDRGFRDVTAAGVAQLSTIVPRIRNQCREGRIACVLFFVDDVHRIKDVSSLTGIENCGVIPLVPSRRADLTLLLLQKTNLKDVEQVPFNPEMLFLKVEKMLIRLHMQRMIVENNRRNRAFFLKIVRVMAKLLEERDEYTEHHSENVARIACAIARRFGFDAAELGKLEMAGLLHDFGKIGITDYILNKPSRLTEEEYEVIKKHPSIAQIILEPIKDLEEIIPWIKHHHERWDGTGYPDGLKGEEIPLPSRILAVADAYDTMHSRRTYHEPYDDKVIVRELEENKGTQFDPAVVDVFLEMLAEEKSTFVVEEST